MTYDGTWNDYASDWARALAYKRLGPYDPHFSLDDIVQECAMRLAIVEERYAGKPLPERAQLWRVSCCNRLRDMMEFFGKRRGLWAVLSWPDADVRLSAEDEALDEVDAVLDTKRSVQKFIEFIAERPRALPRRSGETDTEHVARLVAYGKKNGVRTTVTDVRDWIEENKHRVNLALSVQETEEAGLLKQEV